MDSCLQISLHEGGRIVNWTLGDQVIIAEPKNSDYSASYAGAMLCPFTNRIEDGTYNFNQKKYQLKINEENLNHALHGLVYNQSFELLYLVEEDTFSEIALTCHYNGQAKGYPFVFSINLTYRLENTSLKVIVEVTNLSMQSIPMALGWHPYFFSDNRDNSFLQFDAVKKFINNPRNIPVDAVDFNQTVQLNFKDFFDDGFELSSPQLTFNTPKYQLTFLLDKHTKFLQIYTPANQAVVAIEPMTAAANSFNNLQGLHVLDAQSSMKQQITIQYTKH